MTKDEVAQRVAEWSAKRAAMSPEERVEADRKRTREIFAKWAGTFAALAEHEREVSA